MARLLGVALTLGLAGLDPTAALVAVAALVAGASRRALAAFGLTVMIGVPLFGSALSLTVGTRLVHLHWWVLVPRGRVGAVVGLGVGLALLGVGVARLVRRAGPAAAPRRRRVGTPAMVAAGAVYMVSLVIDPTFVAVTVVAGRVARPQDAVLMQIVWALLSQSPLVVLLVAVRRVGQQRAVEQFQLRWARARPVIWRSVTVALAVGGVVLVVDALWWFDTGHFLLPGPGHRA